MKGLMIFANGFEDVEALATVDVLKRAGLNLCLATLNDTKEVETARKITILVDKTLKEINYKEFDYLIIPGGGAVFNVLDKSPLVDEMIKHFCDTKKLTCAICAAPLLLGKHGYLKNLKYTCFPGCEEKIIGGFKQKEPVVVEENIITARSMYYSCDFAIEIIKKLLGKETANKILSQIKGE